MRRAIRDAANQLLLEVPARELSIAAIARRAGIARSAFYFYFDSKEALLASMLAEVSSEIVDRTDQFVRRPEEAPREHIERALSEVAIAYDRHRPLLAACLPGRNVDANLDAIVRHELDMVVDRIVSALSAEVRTGTARPISPDLTALVQILTATTTLLATGDSLFSGPESHSAPMWQALAQLWTAALWGSQRTDCPDTSR